MGRMKSLIQLLSLCAFTLAAGAQDPQPAVPAPNGPIHLNVEVTTHSGDPVPNLPQSAFTVLDNGKPQPIQSFRAVTADQAKTSVMLVVDAVNIPYIQLAYERNQIDAFLKANDGKLAVPTSILIFTDTGTQTTGFTTNGNELSQTFDQKEIGLRDLRRSAGFWGAAERMDISLKTMEAILERARSLPGRKVILWVSPGWPLLSGPAVQLTFNQEQSFFHTIVAISNVVREGDITIYAVDPLGAVESPGRTFYYEEFLKGVSKPSQVYPGDVGLQVLAVQSGGLVLTGSNDIRALLQHCISDTRTFYEITYAPPPSDAHDEYHKVEVRVAAPDAKARTLQGYYGQPSH